MDGLDAVSVGEAVAKAQPDTIVHQMTGVSVAHADQPDLKHFDRWAVPTIRLRTEGTDHLLAAAQATGVSHVVAQGYANWNCIRAGGWVKTEEDPLDAGRVRGRQAADADPEVAGPAAGRGNVAGSQEHQGSRLRAASLAEDGAGCGSTGGPG